MPRTAKAVEHSHRSPSSSQTRESAIPVWTATRKRCFKMVQKVDRRASLQPNKTWNTLLPQTYFQKSRYFTNPPQRAYSRGFGPDCNRHYSETLFQNLILAIAITLSATKYDTETPDKANLFSKLAHHVPHPRNPSPLYLKYKDMYNTALRRRACAGSTLSRM